MKRKYIINLNWCILFIILMSNSKPATYALEIPHQTITLICNSDFLIKPELAVYWDFIYNTLVATSSILLGVDAGLYIAELNDSFTSTNSTYYNNATPTILSNSTVIAADQNTTFTALHKGLSSAALIELSLSEAILALQGMQRLYTGHPMPPGVRSLHIVTGSSAAFGLMAICLGLLTDFRLADQVGNVVILTAYMMQAFTTDCKTLGSNPLVIWQLIIGNLGLVAFTVAAFIPPEYGNAIKGSLASGLGLFFMALLPNSAVLIIYIIKNKFRHKDN